MSTLTSDYIVDCFMMREKLRSESGPTSLKGIFADEGVAKILHGCDTDLKYLVADFGIVTANVFDTARAF